MRSHWIFFLLLCSSLLGSAQTTFQKTFGGDQTDVGYSVVHTPDNNILISGVTKSFDQSKEIYVLKMDTAGNNIWSHVYGTKKVEVGRNMSVTQDGGVIIAGDASGYGAGRKDMLLLKLKADGSLDWAKTYGSKLNDYCLNVTPTSDGGYLAVGETNGFDAWDTDIIAIKTDAFGNPEWSKLIGMDTVEYANSVIEVSDGFILAGETNSLGESDWDILILKLDEEGDLLWTKSLGDTLNDNQDDLIFDTDTSFVVVGSSESYSFLERDVLFIRCTIDGHVQLAKTYGGDRSEEPKSVRRLDDGYVIGGFSNSFNEHITEEDMYIIRTNHEGTLMYSKTFGGERNDFGWAMDAAMGHFVIVGGTNSYSEREEDEFLYAVRAMDARKVMNCEQTNPQTISLQINPERLHEHEVSMQVRDIQVHVESHDEMKMREVENQLLDVCSEGVFYTDQPSEEIEDDGVIQFE